MSTDGSNQSGFESPGQLRHDVRFSLLFFIWGVGMEQANYNWTAQEAAFERQCQAVKAMSPQRPCLVYLDWGTTLGWYTAQAEAASDPSLEDIWLRDESGQRLGFTDCHDPRCPRDLLLDFRRPAAVDWWVERVVEPLIASDAVDGVFFDSVGLVGGCGDLLSAFCSANTTHCGSLVDLPARRALYNGTINALARVSQLHAAYRKTPVYSLADYGPFEVFSEYETSPPSCVEPEEDVVDALSGLPWVSAAASFCRARWNVALPHVLRPFADRCVFTKSGPRTTRRRRCRDTASATCGTLCARQPWGSVRPYPAPAFHLVLMVLTAAYIAAFAVHAFADGYPTPSRCVRASKGSEGSARKGWSTGRLLRPGNSSGAEHGYPACRAECAADSRCVGFAAIVPPNSGAPFCQLLNSITQTNSDERWLSWSKSGESRKALCCCATVADGSVPCSFPNSHERLQLQQPRRRRIFSRLCATREARDQLLAGCFSRGLQPALQLLFCEHWKARVPGRRLPVA